MSAHPFRSTSHALTTLLVSSFGTYIEFVAMLVALHCGMFLLLHGFETYVTILGFLALGLEATVRRRPL